MTDTEHVKDLYPEPTDEVDFKAFVERVSRDVSESVVLDVEDVRRAVSCLRTDSAPGLSSWTNAFLRRIGTHGSDAQQESFAALLTSTFNRYLAGRMPAEVHQLWTDARHFFHSEGTHG